MSKHTRPCEMCGTPIQGRSDKTCCSVECKRERKRKYDRERYPELRDDIIKRVCERQRQNVEQKRLYDREYRKTRDKEKHAAWGREFKKANPEYGRMLVAKRRSRKLANGEFAVTLTDLRRLKLQYSNTCAYCRGEFTEGNPLEWDHVIPISRGGTHCVGNILPSCRKCNRSKAHKFITEWRNGRFVPRDRSPAA